MKNERKLNELIRAAEKLPGITPPEDFAERILSEIDASRESTIILFEAALPKFAWAAVLIVGLFIAAEITMNIRDYPNLAEGAIKVTNQWDAEFDLNTIP